MKKIFYIFLSRPVTSVTIFFTIVVLGIFSYFNLSVELSPHVEFPKLTVRTYWGRVSPEIIEAYVTSPIEEELAKIKGLKNLQSRSSIGYSNVTMEFYPGTDMNFTRIQIYEKLASLKKILPYGVSSPRISQYVPQDLRELQGFLTYSVSGPGNPGLIRKTVEEKLKYPLMSVRGVSNVRVTGGTQKQITIIVDYQKAKALNISNDEIVSAIRNTELIRSAGAIKANGLKYSVKIKNLIGNIDVIANRVIKTDKEGNSIKLKQIAKIYYDYAEPDSYYRINGLETVSLIISKEANANTLKTAERIYRKIAELSSQLPKGFQIVKEIDRSQSVRNELKELTESGYFSLAIIILVLFLIYKRIKYALIIITSIAFSLFLSLFLYYIFNISLNILTIAAFILGFGFMVDNSIVVIDYIDSRYRGEGLKYLAVHLKHIFLPVFASTLTTVAVFLPLLFLTGELRLYFVQFALGIIFTLSASLAVSFTIIPLLFVKIVKKRRNAEVRHYSHLFTAYSFLMSKLFKWKKLSLTILILLIGLPVWLLPNKINTPILKYVYNPVFSSEAWQQIKPYVNYALGGSLNLFFNHIERGEVWKTGESTYLYVSIELPNGNKIQRINNLTKKIENEILKYRKNFKLVVANVYNEENASVRIEFTNEQSNSAFPFILKNYLTSYATLLGGCNIGIYGFGPGFYNGYGGSFNYAVAVKGYNFLKVKEIAQNFKELISQNPRIDNVDIDKSMVFGNKDVYEISAYINRNKLSEYGISAEALLLNIARNTEGNLSYNRFLLDNAEVNYFVKFSNYKNLQLRKLKNLIIKNKNGIEFKVSDIVRFNKTKVMPTINRENQQYVRYISFDYKGPYYYGDKFVKSSLKKMILPEGYTIKQSKFLFLFGKKEEINIWKILLLSAILIFMITASLFESLKKPSLIFIAIPFAIVGTLFLFYFGDFNLDRGAYAGILLLIGLSVNNSIILVDQLTKIYEANFDKIIKASFSRLRPIFTTTFTTIAALIPLLFSQKDNFWKSLSLSVIGGIFLSAIIVILYLPLIYYLVSKKHS